LSKRTILSLVALGILASAGFRAWRTLQAPPEGDPFRIVALSRLYTGLDTRADALLMGCLVGLLVSWRFLPLAPWFRPLIRLGGIGSLVGIGVCVWLCPAPWSCVAMPLALFTLVALGTAIFLVGMLTAPLPGVKQVLEFGPLVGIGRISYGLYLFHYPIMIYLAHHGPNPFSRRGAVMMVGLSIGAALLSFFFVERPLLRLKHRKPTRLPPAPVVVPARAA
jgi:peptidoglycan/LPS O-acetylase OafA/YrhL